MRSIYRFSSVLATCLSLLGPGCGTDAAGVEACRSIESARCRAAVACGIVDDAAACERFYRDHCLHGLRGDTPSDREVARCVQTIETAGECAASGDDAGDCAGSCDIVDAPERAIACVFLDPDSEAAEEDEEQAEEKPTGGEAGGGAGGGTENDEPAGAGGTPTD